MGEVEESIKLSDSNECRNEEELRKELAAAHSEKEEMLEAGIRTVELHKAKTVELEASMINRKLKQKLCVNHN